MAAIYRLPRDGGARSQRFTAYLDLIRRSDGSGLQAFNPMAGDSALETVALLLGAEAEAQARAGAEQAIELCGVDVEIELAVIVASPGLWTDRLITEAEHRLRPDRGAPALVQLWAGEPPKVEREARAEAVRVIWNHVHGPPTDLSQALAREGQALALGGDRPAPLTRREKEDVVAALELLGASAARQDILSVAYGDPIAIALGWPRIGLPERAGVRHATARALLAGHQWSDPGTPASSSR